MTCPKIWRNFAGHSSKIVPLGHAKAGFFYPNVHRSRFLLGRSIGLLLAPNGRATILGSVVEYGLHHPQQPPVPRGQESLPSLGMLLGHHHAQRPFWVGQTTEVPAVKGIAVGAIARERPILGMGHWVLPQFGIQVVGNQAVGWGSEVGNGGCPVDQVLRQAAVPR